MTPRTAIGISAISPKRRTDGRHAPKLLSIPENAPRRVARKITRFTRPSPGTTVAASGFIHPEVLMSSPRTMAFVLGAMLLTCSCGGGGGYGATPSPTSPTAPSTPSTNVVTITIVGVHGAMSFSPNPATVPAGQMVVFVNTDTVTHRVVLDDGSIDTGPIAPNASSTPQALGGVSKPYHCSIHPSMVGSLNSAQTPDAPPCTGYCG